MNEIIKKLKKDELKNINLINFIKNNQINEIYMENNSLLVKGISDQKWIYFSSDSSTDMGILLKKLDNNDKAFAAIEKWMLPQLINKNYSWMLSCMKMYYPDQMKTGQSKEKIKQLKIGDAEYIYNRSDYSNYTTIQYIEQRIKNGIALGIYDQETLVAWIMTHDDGAIGFLHVLEKYRNNGYGMDLTYSIINRLRKNNAIPFVHIELDNKKSLNLARKIGFQKDRELYWFQLL